MIDAILNNFAVYKRQPLYVNLDEYLKRGYPVADLIRNRSYIVKTHFPQVLTQHHEPQIRRVAEHAVVLTPVRCPIQSFYSAVTFGVPMEKDSFHRSINQFEEYWGQFEPLRVQFAALTAQAGYEVLIKNIAWHIGVPPNKDLIYPIDKKRQHWIYTLKFLTRLLGYKSPIVNTTIAPAKSYKEIKQMM